MWAWTQKIREVILNPIDKLVHRCTGNFQFKLFVYCISAKIMKWLKKGVKSGQYNFKYFSLNLFTYYFFTCRNGYLEWKKENKPLYFVCKNMNNTKVQKITKRWQFIQYLYHLKKTILLEAMYYLEKRWCQLKQQFCMF